MAELGWTVSEVTQEHLQNHVSQGYMTVVELVTCRVPEDPTSPVQTGGMHRAMHGVLQVWGLVCHQTSFSTLCYSSMAWSCIT
jgi:hypothetical protein